MGRRRIVTTFVSINLFQVTCWFGIFCQKSPNDVGKEVLCAVEESLEVSLPSDG
jgi:hypothetical protein